MTRTRRIATWIGSVLLVTAIVASGLIYWRAAKEPLTAGGAATMRLISAAEYVNAIRDVFGEDFSVTANFPLPQRREGLLALGAATASMTAGALEQFDRAARGIAAQVVDAAHRDTLIPCSPRAPDRGDADCARTFLSRAGRLLFRGTLTVAELDAYVNIATSAAEDRHDFYTGLAYGLGGMLSSPEFLYVTEVVEPDPDNAGRLRLDGYSKAARLSLFLWDSLPDEQLLDAAEAGELHERAGLARQIERMLEPTRLERGVRAFFSDFLRLEDFVSISKDPVIYPAFTYEAGQGAHEQTLRMVVDHLLTRHADYRELFTSEHTFVDGALGPLYQSAVPSDARRDWIPLQMERARSAGLLTSVSFLASHSHPGRSSPTLRGLAIREIFLCQEIPDPPPNVDFKLFEGLTGQMTARDRLRAHSTDPVCVGCHKLTDPIGLALENFDGAGQFRTVENGTAIDASGEFDGQRFSNVAEFGRALHDHPALAPCLAKRLYAYGVGRDPGKEERQWLRWIASRFESDGYRFPELLREIASSSAFYAVSANEQSAAPTMADAG